MPQVPAEATAAQANKFFFPGMVGIDAMPGCRDAIGPSVIGGPDRSIMQGRIALLENCVQLLSPRTDSVQGFQTSSLSASHLAAASSWVILSRSTKAAMEPICGVLNVSFENTV